MIQKINTDNSIFMLTNGGNGKLNVSCGNAAAPARTDSYTPMPQTQAADAYGPDDQTPINPQDAFYLKVGYYADGTEIHFPPDSAPLATKKAWIEAMKKIPLDQQMMIKGDILFSHQVLSGSLQPSSSSEIKTYLNGISSFQPLFEQLIGKVKQELAGGNPGSGARDALSDWQSILQTFQKYNIS